MIMIDKNTCNDRLVCNVKGKISIYTLLKYVSVIER